MRHDFGCRPLDDFSSIRSGPSRRGVWVVIAALLVGATLSGVGARLVQAWVPPDGMPDQENLDAVPGPTDLGKWPDAPGGVAGRPYVKSLALINGTTVTTLISNGTATSPNTGAQGDVRLAIGAYNLCRTGTTGTNCYASPNRVGITVGYIRQSNQLGYNFTSPTKPDSSALTLPTPVDQNTVIEAVINMNTWGDKLRWTYLNGVPSFWKIDNRGLPNAEITVRFTLTTAPSMWCTSKVPVSACDPSEPAAHFGRPYEPEPILQGNMVLSLDATGVSDALGGVLFAATNADIGSLDAEVPGSPLAYGIVGPTEMGGAPNSARFSAFVSDVSLVNHFGVTAGDVATDSFRDTALAVTRADGGTTGTPSWTRWSAAANGTDGWYLDITGIRFDGAAVAPSSVAPAGSTVHSMAQTGLSQPAKITVKPKIKVRLTTRRVKKSVTLSVSAKVAACAKVKCRIIFSKVTDANSTSGKKLRTVAVSRRSRSVRASATVTIPRGQRVTAVVQARQGNRWVYVGSAVAQS